jgi:hypothetical protein
MPFSSFLRDDGEWAGVDRAESGGRRRLTSKLIMEFDGHRNTYLKFLAFVGPICAEALCVDVGIVHLCDNYLVVTVNGVNGTLIEAVLVDRATDGSVAGLDQVDNQFVANKSEGMHRWLLSVDAKQKKNIVIDNILTTVLAVK